MKPIPDYSVKAFDKDSLDWIILTRIKKKKKKKRLLW